MKICVVSDTHDDGVRLAAAVQAARAEGAEAVVHCGDIIGANTLRRALAAGLPMHVVHGNNLGDPVALQQLAARSGGLLHYHGNDADLALAGRRIFVVHYPHYGRAIAATGEFDLVCCGHSHVAALSEQTNIRGGRTWLVNPGSTGGVAAPATWALADLATMRFEVRSVPE